MFGYSNVFNLDRDNWAPQGYANMKSIRFKEDRANRLTVIFKWKQSYWYIYKILILNNVTVIVHKTIRDFKIIHDYQFPRFSWWWLGGRGAVEGVDGLMADGLDGSLTPLLNKSFYYAVNPVYL